jgi:DnaJ-class molecular chaperone
LFNGVSKDIRHRRMINGRPDDVILPLDIEAGTLGGTQFRFEGEGDWASGCVPQDVVCVIKELTHQRFMREKDDLIVGIEIGLKESLCGVERTVEGIDGAQVPVVTRKVLRPGSEVVIAGQGMTRTAKRGGGRGNMRVRIDVTYPEELGDEARELIAAALPD